MTLVEEVEVDRDTIDLAAYRSARQPKAPQPIQFPSEQVMAAFAVIGYVLGGRFLFLLSCVGAFVLAYMAMQSPDWLKIVTLGVYCLLCLLPVARYGAQNTPQAS